MPIFPLAAKMFRERTPEGKEELALEQEPERAERHRGVYTSLGVRVVAHKVGALELSWRTGKDVSKECVSPRCKASATTS